MTDAPTTRRSSRKRTASRRIQDSKESNELLLNTDDLPQEEEQQQQQQDEDEERAKGKGAKRRKLETREKKEVEEAQFDPTVEFRTRRPPGTTFDSLPQDTVLQVFMFLNHLDILHTMMLLSKSCFATARSDVLWQLFIDRMWNSYDMSIVQDIGPRHAFRIIYTTHCVECGISPIRRGMIRLRAISGDNAVHMCQRCGYADSSNQNDNLISIAECARDFELSKDDMNHIPILSNYKNRQLRPRKLVMLLANDFHFSIGGVKGLWKREEEREKQKAELKQRRQETLIKNQENRRKKLLAELERRGIAPEQHEEMIESFVEGCSDTKSVRKYADRIQKEERKTAILDALAKKGFRFDPMDDLQVQEFVENGQIGELDTAVESASQRFRSAISALQEQEAEAPQTDDFSEEELNIVRKLGCTIEGKMTALLQMIESAAANSDDVNAEMSCFRLNVKRRVICFPADQSEHLVQSTARELSMSAVQYTRHTIGRRPVLMKRHNWRCPCQTKQQ